MGKWITTYDDLKSKHKYVKPNPPATHQITDIEERLRVKLPTDLRELLLEVNGDNWLIFSTEQIVETNLTLRSLNCFISVDCLLFFGGNGCGDYFGYPITREDGVRDDSVFMWDHESDSSNWIASSLEDTITKYFNAEI